MNVAHQIFTSLVWAVWTKRDFVTGEIAIEPRNYCGIYAALFLFDFCRPTAGRPGAFLTAVGDCRRYGKHLVLYTYDLEHPPVERFESQVLSNPRVQTLSAGLVWFKRPMTSDEARQAREEAGDPKQPAPPRVEVVTWSLDEVLAGPADPRTISADAFAELLGEALAVDADRGE